MSPTPTAHTPARARFVVSPATSSARLLGLLDPVGLACRLWALRGLVGQFTRREIEGRYRGSLLGLLWTFVQPLTLLATYTFVFGSVFKARWPEARDDGLHQFALALFCGLIPYNLLAECAQRAPGLVVAVPNYVRKVVFPLEVLPLASLGSALFHAAASLLVLLAAQLASGAGLPWTVLLVPLVLLPLVFLSLGVAWFLASLGVFVRDVGHLIGLLTQVLLFATPIFYPPTALPAALRPWLALNPLVDVVENLRRVVLWGRLPEWPALGCWLLITLLLLLLGQAWFMKTKRGFADVL